MAEHLFSPGPGLFEQARDRTSSPSVLEELFQSRFSHPKPIQNLLLQALAQNPNTPLAILERLAQQVASAFLKNPALDLLEVAEPEWFSRLWLFVPAEMPSSSISQRLFRWLQNHPHQLRNLLHRKDCRLEWLQECATHPSPWVRGAVASHPLCPRVLLDSLRNDPIASVRSSIAGREDLPEEWVLELLRDPEPRVRAALCRFGRCSRQVLEILFQDDSEPVCLAVAAHPGLTDAELLVRAQSNRISVRQVVAERQSLPPQVLELLWQDAAPEVVESLLEAQHPMPAWFQDQFLHAGGTAKAGGFLAKHPDLRREHFRSLATPDLAHAIWNWKASMIRFLEAFASNPRLPLEWVWRLACTGREPVLHDLTKSKKLPNADLPIFGQENDVVSEATQIHRERF